MVENGLGDGGTLAYTAKRCSVTETVMHTGLGNSRIGPLAL